MVATIDGVDPTSNGVGPVSLKEDRSKAYLLRIVALTGATQMGNLSRTWNLVVPILMS
jgi:hypothetical protein